jgi:hypothetical protein
LAFLDISASEQDLHPFLAPKNEEGFMADQKRQGSQPDRQGQNPGTGTGTERNNDPNRQGQERSGQSGSPREQNNPERGSQRTGTEKGSETTRNRPEGDVEGLGSESTR